MFVFKEKKKEPNFTVLADGTVEKALEDGAIERDFADGHHEVIDADGNIELDDLDSDKDSYCEEVDVRDADGNVHHVKKWHHHSMDHFKEHGHKYGVVTIMVGLALGLGLGLGLAIAVASANNDAAARDAALAASAGTTMEPVSAIPAKGDSSRRRLLSRRNTNFWNYDLISDSLEKVGLNNLLKRDRKKKLREATPVGSLSLLSDYHMHPDPEYSVTDPSNGPAELLTTIGCYVGQLRGRDIGVSMEDGDPNPDGKPYIALVDGSLCEDAEGGASIFKWAVKVQTTAPNGGDGVYTTNFIFYMGPAPLYGELKNTIAGNTLVKSELSFNQGPDAMKGGIIINKEDPTKVTVKFFQSQEDNGNTYYSQLSVQYDQNTGVGQAITSDGSDVYNIAFSEDAYLRELEGGSTVCVEFDTVNSITSADNYVLFNADDGSRSLFSSGSMVTSADGTKEAYIDNWGGWSFDGDASWLVNDADVIKVGYSATSSNNYKLKVASGKLINVKTLKIKLSQLTQTPLSVYESGDVSRKIAWSGTQLETVQSVANMCIRYGGDGYEIFNNDEPNTDKCYCYDSNGDALTSGQMNQIDNLDSMARTTVLSSPTAFVPTAAEFSNGIEVRSGDLWGKINLKYENIEKLYLNTPGSFQMGQTVTQTSSGASGTVQTSTATSLKGYTCSSCVTLTYPMMIDCATEVSDAESFLPKGAVLTQNAVVATVVEEAHGVEWGIPIEFTTGNSFDYAVDIVVSYPSDGSLSLSWGATLSGVSGTLSKPVSASDGDLTSSSDYVLVKMDAGSPKFVAGGSNILVADVDKGNCVYNEAKSGEIEAVTGDTEVSFQVWATVQPGTTVPELMCYENCPDPTNRNTCKAYGATDCYRPGSSHLGDYGDASAFSCEGSAGSVSSLPTSGTFANIGGSPAATITWNEEDAGGGNSRYYPQVEITNYGSVCSQETIPTLTLADANSVCSGAPSLVVNLECYVGTDFNDYGQAKIYTYTSGTGVLEDSSNNDCSIGSSNSNYYDTNSGGNYMPNIQFGPFAPNNQATKDSMVCEWNEDFICPWRLWELDSLYMFESGESSRRFTLEDSDGNPTFFSSALNMLYVHEGTASNSGKDYNGATSLLSYRGPGQLTGLPQFCIDSNTGQKAAECIPEGSDSSTLNSFDIRIDPAVAMEDTNGNKYYAKYESVSEIYPVVSGGASNALCSSLTLPNGSGEVQLPTLDDCYTAPSNLNEAFPDAAALEANYLYGGEPAVIQGSTLKELEEAAKALAAGTL